MWNIKVKVVVEGKTERLFVNKLLATYLSNHGILITSKEAGKEGGNKYSWAKSDIGIFLKMEMNTYISTMFDYFRIDSKWPGKANVYQRVKSGESISALQKAEMVETEMHNNIVHSFHEFRADKRFVPYISMHEFESLLFSHPNALAEGLNVESSPFREILEQYDTPEEINDGDATAPSKRLERLCPFYNQKTKVSIDIRIAEAIGIPTMRKKCPHFDAWLRKLENLESL